MTSTNVNSDNFTKFCRVKDSQLNIEEFLELRCNYCTGSNIREDKIHGHRCVDCNITFKKPKVALQINNKLVFG